MERIVISNFKTGLETDLEPFLLNNDSFPILNNARFWRGRIRKKQGSDLLGRLQRDFTTESFTTTDGAGAFTNNIKTFFSLETNSEIRPGSVTVFVVGALNETFTSTTVDGVLTGTITGTGTINYITGAITLLGSVFNAAITITYSYYPCLPVLGLEEFVQGIQTPDTIHFDQTYSYRINQSTEIYFDVSFYKSTFNRLIWSGADYEQFWGISYRNALWATNNKPGFHFLEIDDITKGSPTNIKIIGHGLDTNDKVFVNEVLGMDDSATPPVTGINGKTFDVTLVDVDNFTINLDSGALTDPTIETGIVQLLTSSLDNTRDGIRYYDGDPNGAAAPNNLGWVNFAPPLSNLGLTGGSPDYLVGAQAIVAFKDRLLFFGVWTQKSVGGSIQFPNRMVYSQNGTPYYVDDEAFTPLDQGGQGEAWFTNIPARGGFLGAPVQQEFVNASNDGDVLIVQFTNSQRRLIFSQDDSFPFYYQTIDSELGTLHTFSGIALDKGVLSIGNRGITLTTQASTVRIDDKIPDAVFDEISKFNNDEKRVTAIRDYRNEYVYWTFTPKNLEDDNNISRFPTRTLIFNYKDASWSTQDDHYTHYGYYSKNETYTWATLPFDTWTEWVNPWNFGGAGERFPLIIGGDSQGFIRRIDLGSAEASSHHISAISGQTITSNNHDINDGDYVIIESGIAITVDSKPSASNLPSTARRVIEIIDENNFRVDGSAFVGTLLGGGTFRKVNNYDIRTKMFPNFWGNGMGTEIGQQKYLFGRVPNGQTNAFIYTNINDNYAANDPEYNNYTPVTPIVSMDENDLFFNKGSVNQIWKQASGSFSGATVQVQFRLSDAQMKDPIRNETDFVLHAIAIEISPGAEL